MIRARVSVRSLYSNAVVRHQPDLAPSCLVSSATSRGYVASSYSSTNQVTPCGGTRIGRPMESSRATENVLAGPPCSTPSPRYSGEKAAVQGDKMGKIAVKAASRMFRVSPPSTSSLRPAPYGGSSIAAPAGAGSVHRTASPRDQLRPQVHGPGHSGLPACPAPSHHFAVIPRIAPGVPVSVVSRHVSRAMGRWDYRSPVARVRLSCARRCAPPESATKLPILTQVMDTQAQLRPVLWEGGGSGRPRLCMNHKHSS